MKRLLLLIILLIPIFALAQKVNKKTEAQIMQEGYLLYKSEVASWHGTDLFLQNHPELKDKAAGYFSYSFQDSTKCIFFSKSDVPTSLVSFTFDNSLDVKKARTDTREKAFTQHEADLYQIRKKTLAEINSDTLFKSFNNTSLNLVPIIEGDQKKVYVLTGPQVGGVVILGNDYLISFDKSNKIKNKQKLHQNLIPIEYAKSETEGTVTMHTHLPATGAYLTPTDVCTLLLYGKMSNWKQHYTISEDFVTLWEVDKGTALTLTRKAWDKIMKHSATSSKD